MDSVLLCGIVFADNLHGRGRSVNGGTHGRQQPLGNLPMGMSQCHGERRHSVIVYELDIGGVMHGEIVCNIFVAFLTSHHERRGSLGIGMLQLEQTDSKGTTPF